MSGTEDCFREQRSDIRRLVSGTAPAQAIGGWQVASVPNGVRVTTNDELHFDRVAKALTHQGCKVVRMKPVRGAKVKRHCLVVTGWDGVRIKAMLQGLRKHVHDLTEELAKCPTRTVELYEQYRLFEGYDRASAVDLTLDQLERERLRLSPESEWEANEAIGQLRLADSEAWLPTKHAN